MFCGASGKRSKEHIFARSWLAELDPRAGERLHRHIRGEQGKEFDQWWSHHEADLVVKSVCKKCNESWMDRLDKDAERLTTPIARGERTELATHADQALLLAWITKLALLFDYKQSRSTVPAEIPRRFKEVRKPPPHAWVWLACAVPLLPFHASGLTWTLGENDRSDVFMVVIRVNYLVAQFVLPLQGKTIHPVRPRFADAVLQLWPLTYERMTFPPRCLDPVEYVTLCSGFVKSYSERGI